MKIRPVGAELFHADRQVDRHGESTNRFSQFCEPCLIRQQQYTLPYYFSVPRQWRLFCLLLRTANKYRGNI